MNPAVEQAWQALFAEAWALIDQEVAKASDLPTWKTLAQTRRQLEARFRGDPRAKRHDPGDWSDRHLLVTAFRDYALPTAKVTADAVMHIAVLVPPRAMAKLRRTYGLKDIPKAPVKRPAYLRKADARNLEVLAFVVERIIPFDQLLNKRPGKNGEDVRLLPGHRGRKVAVPRQALADEWNRTHPYDVMGSGDVLMGQFHRAATRPHLRDAFIRQVASAVDKEWQEQRNALARISEHLQLDERSEEQIEADIERATREWPSAAAGRALEKAHREFVELRARQRAGFPSEEEYQKWRAEQDAKRRQAYRDSLTREELIEDRVCSLLLSMADDDPQQPVQLWKAPLRDWFLIELQGGRGSFWFPWRPRRSSRET